MTGLDWLEIFRSDPVFERMVKNSGVIKTRFKPLSTTPISSQASKAVEVFRTAGETRLEFDSYAQSNYSTTLNNVRTALVCWFSENWERWIKGEWRCD